MFANKKLRRLVLCVCALGLFIDGYDLYISAIAEPFINERYHPTPFLIGIIQACAPLGAVLGAVVMGRIADLIGRKTMLVANLLFFVIIALLSSLAWNITSLCVFRFLIGFGVGADYPIVAAYLAEMIEPAKRAKAMAIIMFVNCIASPIGALVAWFTFSLYPHIDAWRILFALGALPAILGLVLRAKLPESLTWRAQKKLASRHNKNYSSLFQSPLKQQTIILCACWFFMDISYYGIGLFTPSILHALQLNGSVSFLTNAAQVLKSTLFVNLFTMAGAFSVIFFITKIDLINLQKFGFLAAFVSILFMASHPSFSYVLLGFMLFNFFINFGPGITTYYLPTVIYPSSIKASGHGLASGFGKLGAVVGTLFLPALQHQVGIHATLGMLSITLLIGFLLTKRLNYRGEHHGDVNELLTES
jgi:MFS family permease